MDNVNKLLKRGFESSCSETQQFRGFYNTFKREFKAVVKDRIKDIKFNKGHFYLSGFLTTLKGSIFYFSIDDVRWSKGNFLIRTAKHYKDFSGGSNNMMDYRSPDFEQKVNRFIGV